MPSYSLFQGNLEVCRALSERFALIDKQRSELAVYLCEDANQLSLEELFGTLRTFRELFIKALKVKDDDLLVLVILTMHISMCIFTALSSLLCIGVLFLLSIIIL